MQAGIKFQPASAIQRAGFAALEEECAPLYENDERRSMASVKFGKSIHNSSYK
jgi:hypothetical protein